MDSSWKKPSSWYDSIVSKDGHYYHQELVIPNSLRLLDLKKSSSLLDLACGQGVLARAIPKACAYLGIDGAPELITKAKGYSTHKYLVHDLSTPLELDKSFSHAVICLALQNIEDPSEVLASAHKHLKPKGKLLVVLNHPCFRIPRQSNWGIDEKKKLQYRRVDRYMTPMSIPLQTHPSKGNQSATMMTYHHSLSDISQMLCKAGFAIHVLEEWVSEKKSTGGKAKMENLARKEFPLFMAILAEKG